MGYMHTGGRKAPSGKAPTPPFTPPPMPPCAPAMESAPFTPPPTSEVATDRFPKPPLGLKPRWLHDAFRTYDIVSALERYIEVRKPIPIEWVEEYNELAERRAT